MIGSNKELLEILRDTESKKGIIFESSCNNWSLKKSAITYLILIIIFTSLYNMLQCIIGWTSFSLTESLITLLTMKKIDESCLVCCSIDEFIDASYISKQWRSPTSKIFNISHDKFFWNIAYIEEPEVFCTDRSDSLKEVCDKTGLDIIFKIQYQC